MTPRDRLLAAFDKKPVDVLPVSMFITDSDLNDGLFRGFPGLDYGSEGDPFQRAIRGMLHVFRTLDLDAMVRIDLGVYEPLGFNLEASNWSHRWVREDRNGHPLLAHYIKTPGGTLREVFNLNAEPGNWDPARDWMKARNARVEYFVKSRKDVDLIREFRPAPVWPDPARVLKARNLVGDEGIILPRGTSSVFNYASALRRLDELLCDALVDPDLFRAVMELSVEDASAIGTWVANTGGDAVRVIGNIANGGLVSGQYFRAYIYEYEERLMGALREAGCMVLFHNCGKCKDLLSCYKRLLKGLALESLSPPSAGGDIEDLGEALAVLGPEVTVVGNIDQVNFPVLEDRSEFVRKVVSAVGRLKDRPGFILSTSDSIPSGMVPENLAVMRDISRALGRVPKDGQGRGQRT